MRRPRTIMALVCLAAAVAVGVHAARAQEVDPALAPRDADAPLPPDPRLLTRELDNGLRVVVLPHASPPGRVLVWVRVGVGSLDEREDELAHARLAQEASIAGVRAGEWQAALDRLARRGLNPDEAFGGRTRPDQTIFWLALPDADPDALDAGLSLLGRVVFDATLGGAEVQRARDLALGALRARGGAETRARTQWLAELGGDSLLGRRPPQGDEASVRAASAGGVLAFRSAWYAPNNTSVLIVGDVEARRAARAVGKWFGAMPARATPARQDRGVGRLDERRVAIGTDPELGASEVALVCFGEAWGAVRTYGDLRRFLLRQTAMRALDARVADAIAAGRLGAVDQGVYVADLYGAAQVAQVAATGPADAWRETLAQLCAETQRVREHGFTKGETGEAIASMLTALETYAEREDSLPAGEAMRWLNYNDAAGHVWMTMETELTLARKMLLGVRPEELTRVAGEMMPRGGEAVIVTTPEEGIGRGEVLGIVERAMGRELAAVDDPPRATGLIDREPDAGAVVEISAHPPSGVWSAWLSNNVRVHHRRVPGAGGRVLVRATLGGVDAGGPGALAVSACAEAWARPAVGGLSSRQVRRLLADARVEVSARSEGGALTLEIEASPQDLVIAMELAHRLLRDPVLEEAALERWRRERVIELDKSRHDPVRRIEDVLESVLAGGADAGESVAAVRGVTLGEARSRLAALVASAPLEVAIVGDVSRTEALELSERYLGSLPARPRMGTASVGDLGAEGGRVTRVEAVRTRTPVAGVLVGVTTCGGGDPREARVLAVAARVLQGRLNAALRERMRLVPGVRCEVVGADAAGGRGALVARTTCDPADSAEAARVMEAAIAALGEAPADAEELRAAASQVAGEYRDVLATPEFWAGRLAGLERRGRGLDEVVEALDPARDVTAEEVREAVARCRDRCAGLTLITRPAE